MGGGDVRRAEAPDILIALVVGENDDKVGRARIAAGWQQGPGIASGPSEQDG